MGNQLRGSPSGAEFPAFQWTIPAAAINAGTSAKIDQAVTGAVVGDRLVPSFRSQLTAGLAVSWGVFAAGVASLVVTNPTAGNITPGAPILVDFTYIPQ